MEAMRRQMDRMTLAPPLHGISDVALDFVDKVGSITPGNLNFVKGFSGGSESIEAALKFAHLCVPSDMTRMIIFPSVAVGGSCANGDEFAHRGQVF